MNLTYGNIIIRILSGLYKRKSVFILISSAGLLAGTYTVQAQTASVSQSVNLRRGPGERYGRIATLPRGVRVHVDYCRGGWCQIRSSWGLGWVSGRYLQRAYSSGPSYAPAYPRARSQIYLGLNIGPDYFDRDPFYSPYPRPYYRPNFWPGYRPDRPPYFPRPGGHEGWNPRWGVGPAYPPRRGWY